MNLTLFFRLIVMSIFQSSMNLCRTFRGERFNYDNQYFFCPTVYAKDGFNISLQINNGNYCSSENGYREFGHTWEEVEFGFPSEDDAFLHQYTEGYNCESYDEEGNEIPFDPNSFTSVGKVGRISVSVLEELFEKRGGIDWEKTISVEQFNRFCKSIK